MNRNLESIKLENIYATGPYTGDMETIDWYFKEILKTIQRRFHNGLKLRIPIESYGYSYAEIFKEENELPIVVPRTKMILAMVNE